MSASIETAKEWLMEQPLPLRIVTLTPALARKIAEERLEEAKWWYQKLEYSQQCSVPWIERIADLERKLT